MRTLICTVGLPYSGKSTWARQQCYPVFPIVCPDEIRLALHGQRFEPRAEPMVWAIAKIMVRALFGAGHDTVILDATNTTPKRREEWLSDEWRTLWKVIDTPVETCLARAERAGDAEIKPIIEKMATEIVYPTEDLWL